MAKNCKHEAGYYRYFRTKGKGFISYTSDGVEDENENTDMFHDLEIIEEKTKRCLDCHKIIKTL